MFKKFKGLSFIQKLICLILLFTVGAMVVKFLAGIVVFVVGVSLAIGIILVLLESNTSKSTEYTEKKWFKK